MEWGVLCGYTGDGQFYGYMEIFSGCMTGIRNPRAHKHDWEDTQHRALQLLIFADHLIERVRNSKKQPN